MPSNGRAVRLESSDKVLLYPDDSVDQDNLCCLLAEAQAREVPQDRLILVTQKRRDLRLNEWGYDGAYVYRYRRMTLNELSGLEEHFIQTDRNFDFMALAMRIMRQQFRGY